MRLVPALPLLSLPTQLASSHTPLRAVRHATPDPYLTGGWPSFPSEAPRNRVPHLSRFSKGGQHGPQCNVDSSQTVGRLLCYTGCMPHRLHRYYGAGYSHFITTSCYRRLPLLGSPGNCDLS